VLFLAGENPDNVRYQWYALCDDIGVDPTSLPIRWHAGHFGLAAAAEGLASDAAAIPDLRLVVADTLQAFFEGDDDNSNIQMLAAARAFRRISQLPSSPTVLVPAHPTKGARKDSLVPRGGSALMNEFDGNLTVWREGEVATLHWQGKHRGPSFEPLRFELVRVQPAGLCDENGRQMPCTVARPLVSCRENQIETEVLGREDRALAEIKADQMISGALLGEKLGISRSTAYLLSDLKRRKWIKAKGRGLVLTREGEAVLEDESAGQCARPVPRLRS
jgi:hypothetical protein